MNTALSQLAADFARDGAVCVRGVVGPHLLQRVASAVEANLAAPSELAQVASRADDPARSLDSAAIIP